MILLLSKPVQENKNPDLLAEVCQKLLHDLVSVP